MKVIKINEKEYNVFTDLSELTLNRFESISSISAKNLEPMETTLKIMKELFVEDIHENTIEEMDTDEMFEIISNINANPGSFKIQNEIVIDDVVYKLDGNADDFKFKVKQIKTISEAMKKDKFFYISKMASILYIDNSSQENREGIFNKKMTADFILPFLKLIIEKYGK